MNVARSGSVCGSVVAVSLHGVFAGEVADILALREIPFLFVTGYTQVPERRFRHISILTKPFQILDLHQALEEMLAKTSRFAVVDTTQSQKIAHPSNSCASSLF